MQDTESGKANLSVLQLFYTEQPERTANTLTCLKLASYVGANGVVIRESDYIELIDLDEDTVIIKYLLAFLKKDDARCSTYLDYMRRFLIKSHDI